MKLCEYCGINEVKSSRNRFCSNSCSNRHKWSQNVFTIWNKGLTKETDERVARSGRNLIGHRANKLPRKRVFCLNCNNEIIVSINSNREFCCVSCATSWNHKNNLNYGMKNKEMPIEARGKISIAHKGVPEKDWVKQQTSEVMKQYYKDNPEQHEIASKRMKNRHINQEIKYPFSDTSIEKRLQEGLNKCGVLYEKQKTIEGRPDIFINPNICIFADGDYWHNLTGSQDGYKVLRFWEREINSDLDKCINIIKSEISEVNNHVCFSR